MPIFSTSVTLLPRPCPVLRACWSLTPFAPPLLTRPPPSPDARGRHGRRSVSAGQPSMHQRLMHPRPVPQAEELRAASWRT